jgi:hypothetical protein
VNNDDHILDAVFAAFVWVFTWKGEGKTQYASFSIVTFVVVLFIFLRLTN